MLQRPVKENGGLHPCPHAVEGQLPTTNLKIYQTELPLFTDVCVFRMRYSLNNILPVMHELK